MPLVPAVAAAYTRVTVSGGTMERQPHTPQNDASPTGRSGPGAPESELEARRVAWITRIANGDDRALALLYDACVDRVYALALQMLQNSSDAEEITEDVFLKVWRTAASYDPDRGRVLTWMLTICRSHALDRLRARTRRRRLNNAVASEPVEALNDAEPALQALVQGSALQPLLAALPRSAAQVLYLAYFRGYSHREIATVLDMQLGTVKTTLRRTLARLREALN